VEYRRQGGAWTRTWTWTDADMAWPRDADRLPNGHTLVGDTNSGRVLEVDTDGDVVWAIDGVGVYDVERISASDSPAEPAPADRLGIGNRSATDDARSPVTRATATLVPPVLRNSVGFVSPLWLSSLGRVAAIAAAVSGVLAGAVVAGHRLYRSWRGRTKE
jgi:hypothetical protein